jgi:ATP-dependent helicase/nuclease subunit A
LRVSGDLPEWAVSAEGVQRLTGWELVDPERPAPRALAVPAAPVLTAEQEQPVVRRREPLLLAAGAGSGKTAVLVERFVRAVQEDGIAPGRILAITFTERAAGELRARVNERLGTLGEGTLGAARVSEQAYVGTFHGFCARLLRAQAGEAGVEPGFAIFDEGLAGRLRRQAFADALGDFVLGGREEAVDLIAAYTADRARATVLGVHAQLRSRGQRRPALPPPALDLARVAGQQELSSEGERRVQRALDERGARALTLWDELLRRFGERYEAAKSARGGLDFDDLELLAGELLHGDERVRREWAERFELVMVDELQDVNPRQLALVQALERGNLFTVGDEWQSIYGFRHADLGLLRARDAQLAPRGQSLRLTRNFRGRAELLEAVNAVFANRFGAAFTPLRPGREGARERAAHGEPRVELLLSDRRGWGGVGVTGAEAPSSATPWREAEARALAARVAELVRAGRARAGEIAVLLRGTADIDCYERALRAQGLRTVASAGAFWARQEVADLVAYLRALADPADEVALYGVLATPPVGLTADGMALLAREARERGVGVWGAARDPARGPGDGEEREEELGEERERVAAYCEWLERERAVMEESALARLLERALAHTGLHERLRAAEDGERRLANVRRLIELAGEWERSEGRNLRGFLDEAAFQYGGGRLTSAEAIAEPDASVATQAQDAVALMSVHAAKGLEFEVVCIADLGRAPSAGAPDLLVRDERVGVRLVELDDPEPRPALQYAELASERRDAQAEEEDRIAYVAMTRARERLLLSGSCDFASWPRERPGAAPIAWLGPALADELPALCVQAARAGTSAAPELTVGGTDVPLRCRLNVATGVL